MNSMKNIAIYSILFFVISLQGMSQEFELLRSAKCGALAQVKLLLERGVNPNYRNQGWPVASVGDTPLLLASEYGHYEIVKLLIEKGADVNIRSAHYTPLLVASMSN